LVKDEGLPREPAEEFISFLKRTVKGLKLPPELKKWEEDPLPRFLVGTQELTENVGGFKARGIFVFEP
jgi:hypothetical protein